MPPPENCKIAPAKPALERRRIDGWERGSSPRLLLAGREMRYAAPARGRSSVARCVPDRFCHPVSIGRCQMTAAAPSYRTLISALVVAVLIGSAILVGAGTVEAADAP